MLVLLFATTICFAAKPIKTYKDCQKLAAKHNMTVVTETKQCFYAECNDQNPKSYVVYFYDKPYTDGDVRILCYYIDGEFYSNILFFPHYSDGGKCTVGLLNEQVILKDSGGKSIYINSYGQKLYPALLKYHRADLLNKFNKDLEIFIPDDKKKEYQLDDIDKLKHRLDILVGRIKPDDE